MTLLGFVNSALLFALEYGIKFRALLIPLMLYYASKKLLFALIIWNEYRLQRGATEVHWNFDRMVELTKNRKESTLSEQEFDIKYGAYRHEIHRVSSVTREQYELLGKVLSFFELYFVHFGARRLRSKIPIIRPIFIIGDFRSGTSVLERIIEHCPSICAFSATHAHVWHGPKLFEDLVAWLDGFRRDCHCEGWNSPADRGMVYPHSSNNILSRDRPMECEAIWLSCRQHLSVDRNYAWQTLDSQALNRDNNTDRDILNGDTSDPLFEYKFKNAIRMLLHHRYQQLQLQTKQTKQKSTRTHNAIRLRDMRFIWKNPVNGFRIGYLQRLFPDAKFIHIARNPAKTTKSQLLMEESYCQSHYVDISEFRKQGMHPRAPYYNSRRTWYHLFHGHLPNDLYGHLLWPRVWPRTIPEHAAINRYLKAEQRASAMATGVVQHERVVLESLRKYGIDACTVWHEQVLTDATQTLLRVFDFLEIEPRVSKADVISYLECEDFPHGQANKSRVKQSSSWEKGLDFGDETEEVYRILAPCFQRYHTQLKIPVQKRSQARALEQQEPDQEQDEQKDTEQN